jgi:hypothetical protein
VRGGKNRKGDGEGVRRKIRVWGEKGNRGEESGSGEGKVA